MTRSGRTYLLRDGTALAESENLVTLREALHAESHRHSDAGEVMAVQHQDHPTHGVQFHPESFRTEHGERLLENFLRESAA